MRFFDIMGPKSKKDVLKRSQLEVIFRLLA
jgi:hypothetical protein